MSYPFDGKIANQCYKIKNLTSDKTYCEKCDKTVEAPHRAFIQPNYNTFQAFNYLDTPHYIYETKAGVAVVYCSKYCRDRHNHRFVK